MIVHQLLATCCILTGHRHSHTIIATSRKNCSVSARRCLRSLRSHLPWLPSHVKSPAASLTTQPDGSATASLLASTQVRRRRDASSSIGKSNCNGSSASSSLRKNNRGLPTHRHQELKEVASARPLMWRRMPWLACGQASPSRLLDRHATPIRERRLWARRRLSRRSGRKRQKRRLRR